MQTAEVVSGYGGGQEMPLGGYSLLLGVYNVGLAGLGWYLGRRSAPLPPRGDYAEPGHPLQARDLLLLGLATHKLTRTITKDWVTAPVRAPFTEYKGSSIGGEVTETSRGTGVRRAVGDLLTCPYCTGPWVAGALLFGLRALPSYTRAMVTIFSVVTVSDFTHRAYEAAAGASERVKRANAREKEK